MISYYICEFCGKTTIRLTSNVKHHPKCNCTEGGGKTYMKNQTKKVYKSWIKNKKK